MLRQILLLLVCVVPALAGPKPVLVVVEQNPWLSVIGSDSPIFALYEDGTIIYRRTKASVDKPFSVRQVPSAHDEMKQLLSLEGVPNDAFYELTTRTDQVSTGIWTPEKRATIYGDWRRPRDRTVWKSIPDSLRRGLARIERERGRDGAAWLPKDIEVMMWPYEYAPEESIVWPAEWPALSAPTTVRRGSDQYSVYLPSQRLSDLRQFLSTRREKGAVAIEGKKMAVSYRFPFPEEQSWMRKEEDGEPGATDNPDDAQRLREDH